MPKPPESVTGIVLLVFAEPRFVGGNQQPHKR